MQYAIGTLRFLSNTYAYIDVAHAGWMGWPSNFNPFVDLLKDVGSGIPGDHAEVDGFISNTANYNLFVEPYMTANQTINGQPVRSLQGWYDWNDYIDEQSYATALRRALTGGSKAYPAGVGLLCDTSRTAGAVRSGRPLRARPRTSGSSCVRRPSTSGSTREIGATKTGPELCQAGRESRRALSCLCVGETARRIGMNSSALIPTGPDNPQGKGFDPMAATPSTTAIH